MHSYTLLCFASSQSYTTSSRVSPVCQNYILAFVVLAFVDLVQLGGAVITRDDNVLLPEVSSAALIILSNVRFPEITPVSSTVLSASSSTRLRGVQV
ncbi:hypothetical protein D9619_008791 [Psilocybe cf. subviscida]|uniref:Uncharacterized protein n=1 Tax=Psilocybe cf. subviscida TaxID=2480587 RepID=A0A8H5B9W2_9AGAR|nr:hypothetical protein D9619_008791 [Psilocybe cf. subviscida]